MMISALGQQLWKKKLVSGVDYHRKRRRQPVQCSTEVVAEL
jgi:hypothetical protein